LPTKGNPFIKARVDPVLKSGIEGYALAKNMSVAKLLRKVLMAWAREVGLTQNGVGPTLRRIQMLSQALEAQAYSVGIAGIDTQKGREEVYETALELLKEAVRLSESEEAAKNARARMEAMRLVSTISRTVLAITSGYDRRDIEVLLDELKKTNVALQERLREIEEGTAGPREKNRAS
jgi:hypothetical protein